MLGVRPCGPRASDLGRHLDAFIRIVIRNLFLPRELTFQTDVPGRRRYPQPVYYAHVYLPFTLGD